MLTFTRGQLEGIFDSDLDFIVDNIVMGNDPNNQEYLPHYFSNNWAAFGEMVERMYERGFKPDVRSLVTNLVDFGWQRMKVIEGRNRWSFSGLFNPRTASIAAILACQDNSIFKDSTSKKGNNIYEK